MLKTYLKQLNHLLHKNKNQHQSPKISNDIIFSDGKLSGQFTTEEFKKRQKRKLY